MDVWGRDEGQSWADSMVFWFLLFIYYFKVDALSRRIVEMVTWPRPRDAHWFVFSFWKHLACLWSSI